MKYVYTLVCLLCFAGTLYAQGADPDFDRIRDYQGRMDSLKRYCNMLLGSDPNRKDDFPKALFYGLKGLQMARKDDHASRGQLAIVTGVAYYNMTRFDSAQHYMKLAATESSQAGNTSIYAWSQGNLIALYMQTQQSAAADASMEILKSISDTTKDVLALTKCYYGLGNYYYFKSYYSTAQGYFLKSVELNKRISDTSGDNRLRIEYAVQCYMLYKIYTNSDLYDKALAALRDGSRYMNVSSTLKLRYNSAYVELYTNSPYARIDSALFYYRKLEEMPRSSKGVNSEYVMSNIAVAQYYIRSGNISQAPAYIDKGMLMAEESKSLFLLHQVQNIKGIYKFHTGNYDEAIDLLTKATKISRQVNMGNYLESIHILAQAYKAKGDLQKAMDFYDIYDQEKDTFTKANMTRYFADVEIRYRTREKEKQIHSLSSENKLRELELRSATRLRIILISSLVSVGIVALLLYRIYRHKEKLNKQLQDRNKELDRLNAKLALANESKAKLFGIFSHDLRSPVSKIAQFLRLQKDNPGLFSDDTRSEYHEKFSHVTAHLLNTMEDLLLWSKSQMENFSPEYHAVSIGDLLQKELNLLHNQIEEKHLVVSDTIPPSFLSVTDENFMSIICRNLLQNAVRYSPESGTIYLEAGDQSVRITNASPSGMSAEALNDLLRKGEVGSNPFGLGLQIARDLAERIGIRLSFAEEKPGFITATLAWQSTGRHL